MTSPRCKSQQRMGSDVSRVSKAAAQLSLEPFSSATRQIVAGRIIEADTIEGFIFRALGARRGEGSSITRAEETIPTLPYLTWVVEGCGALGRKLVPHECPDRFLPVAWKNSIHRQPGNRACPSALLSSLLSSLLPSFLFSFLLELVFVPVLKILRERESVFARRGGYSRKMLEGGNPRVTWRTCKTTFEKKSRAISKEEERRRKFYTVGKSIWFFEGSRWFTRSTSWNRIRYVSVFVELGIAVVHNESL